MAVVSTKFPIFDLMKLKQGSLLIYEDPVSGLFVRRRASKQTRASPVCLVAALGLRKRAGT